MLVVMKNRDVKQFFKPFLDLKAARSANILEIDTSEGRRYALYCVHQFVDIPRINANWKGIYATNNLKIRAFPSMTGIEA